MSRSNLSRLIIVVLAVIALVMVLVVNSQPDNRLINSFTSAAFNFKYPDNWDYVIPEYNVLLAGTQQTIGNKEPGPTLTVHRNPALADAATLEDALDTYLTQGPLSAGEAWKKLSEPIPSKLSGLPALTIELQGSERPEWPEFHSQITVVVARNSNPYFITISSPVNDWSANRTLLESILQSITITE